ncbi:MAG: endonuclease NucS domain-containing protein [Aminipila sp.]
MREAELRDNISSNIDILEKGLVLLQKEQYIPNSLGTKGFIDLYAKDEKGNHVIIELKKSDASAREAIHEVFKYVEGVKSHLGVRDNEIRVIVASTEWRELLVPFSRFACDTKLNVKGLQIEVSSSKVINTCPVVCVPITNGRFIAPWHDMCWYLNEDTLNSGIQSMEQSCKLKGIDDFIIMVICLTNPTISEREVAMKNAIIQMANSSGAEGKKDVELPAYQFVAYFAMQTLSKEKCLKILSSDKDQYDEAQEIILNTDDENEVLCYLHESVVSLKPAFYTDFYEIGYPAKINEFLENLEYTIQEVRRYGIFKKNDLLSDSTIISELLGEDGSTGQKLKRTVEVFNRTHMESIHTEIKSTLEDNIVWKNHILRCLDEIKNEFPMAKVDISVFNPATGVFTVYLATTRENGYIYIPSYYLLVHNPEPVRMYFGGLQDNGQPLMFNEILDKYYDGRLEALLVSMTWGGRDKRDIDITEDLGCTYRSFRCDIQNQKRSFFVLRDDRWRKCDATNHVELYSEYLEKNEKLVKQIIGKIFPRDDGSMINSSSAERILDDIADVDKGNKLKEYYINSPLECELCGCLLSDEKYMVDGKVKNSFGWAIMCPDCAAFCGEGVGWGTGQLYLRDDSGWLLVGGFDN